MGFDSEFAQTGSRKPWLCFDIETVPMPDCAQYLTEPIDAPSNYKDPEKIKAYIADKRAKQVMDAGLDLDLCEVVAIGCDWTDHENGMAYADTRGTHTEEMLLTEFWGFADRAELIGFNCLTFDLPILLRRSLYLGVPTPKIQIDKFRHDGIVDVLDVLSFGRKDWMRSLAFYAKRFSIPHDDSVKGEDIAVLAANGMWDTIAAHVRADVQTTRALAERIGVIAPVGVQADVNGVPV